MIITSIKFLIVNPLLETFDDFVDDLLCSEADLLKGELDYLLIQHLFQSFDLERIKNTEIKRKDSSLVA